MQHNLTFIAVFIITELVFAFLFAGAAQIFYKKTGLNFKSILKGIIERIFLTICLVNSILTALTFFSALKLATRLKHEEPVESENKFNDYYLVGNLISLLLAIFYSNCWQKNIKLFNIISNS